MRTATLIRRNLTHFRRSNLAVVLGVAAGVTVLAGSLLVGESVRASLRGLVLRRLGNTDSVIVSSGFFREKLAAEFGGACPLIAMESLVTHEAGGRRASRVQVYGVDERFWRFHGGDARAPIGREVLLSAALAEDLQARPGDSILLRVPKPSAIPVESLHGRKDDTGKTLRLTLREVLPAGAMGDFSMRPQQGAVRAVFVPLARLQRDLERAGRVNAILLPGDADWKRAWQLEDAGVRVRVLEAPDALSVEAEGALVSDALAKASGAAAAALGLRAQPVLTYLANTMRAGGREVPYSLITAMDLDPADPPDAITLNEWAARDLNVRPGDAIEAEYFLWHPDGRLVTQTTAFRLTRVVPISGRYADRDLAPEYPGITASRSLHDWDPPFPMNLGRVRPKDEDYWNRYRTTPKAFIPLARGQELWQSRFGKLTSVRIAPAGDSAAFAAKLRASLDPAALGLTLHRVREQSLEAAEGATDFGEYFVYFSFFLMTSALLLTGLFFKLGIEQRMREIGTLRAAGFGAARIRRIFLTEGAVLALAGSLIGMAAAAAYADLILVGLRTWWVDAVGTRLLTLHVTPGALLSGAAGGVASALAAIAFTLRGLDRSTPRDLMAGAAGRRTKSRRLWAPLPPALVAAALLAGSAAGRVPPAAGFFCGAALLLIALLQALWLWLTSPGERLLTSVAGLGFRNATCRPGRSVLCIALIASATFLIVALEAFRRSPREGEAGTGGYALMAESLVSIVHDPNAPEGRDALNLGQFHDVRFTPFRLRPGDDTSCLNLYAPRNPRVIGAKPEFLRSGRFPLDAALLERDEPDGAVPAAADANSMTYVLHKKLGEVVVVEGVRLRLVAALEDSIFQGELLIAEKHFLRAFPGQQGYRFFLIDAPAATATQSSGLLEATLADFDFDVQSTAEKLAAFHRVENTYLSTFQALGGLGLVLGTVGLAAVLLRNVLERRRELALLRAVGFEPRRLAVSVAAENALLLAAGLAAGTLCALLAIAPVLAGRGGGWSFVSTLWLLAAVLATGLIASLAATAAVIRSPLLASLRAE